MIRFVAENHQYTSVKSEDSSIEWLSVTSLISNFKAPFEGEKIAAKCSKNKKSKWYGIAPGEIQAIWKNEAKRATDLGTWYHNQREQDICEFSTIERNGKTLAVNRPVEIEGVKYSGDQRLTDGMYPEHMIYLKSAGLCGQSDFVEVVDGVVNIIDYKTNKEIKTEGFTSWDGRVQKMASPLNHLDDCNLMHYTLQLSMYMYMILKHNPKLKPGTLLLHHVTFEELGKDKYGNPITAVDSHGNPILEDILPYEVPYLKSEAISLIHWLEDNRHLIKPKT